MTATKTNTATLYLTELDVTRLERIASRAGSAQLEDMLDSLLARATIVAPEEIPTDVVTMNTRLVCNLQGEQAPRNWTLVYPDAADFDAGRCRCCRRWARRCWARAPGRPSATGYLTAASSR